MRTALILLFLLAVAAVPGSLLPQRPLNPAKTTSYIASHGSWGDVLECPRHVRRVRLGLVRRDLPAAVRLARRLPDPADPRARARGRPQAAARAAQPRPAARVGPLRDRRERRRPTPRAARQALGRRWRVEQREEPAGARHPVGREGLQPRDRKPDLPRRAARLARADRGRPAVQLPGHRRSSCRGKGFCNTIAQVRLVEAGTVRGRGQGRPGAVLHHRPVEVHRDLHRDGRAVQVRGRPGLPADSVDAEDRTRDDQREPSAAHRRRPGLPDRARLRAAADDPHARRHGRPRHRRVRSRRTPSTLLSEGVFKETGQDRRERRTSAISGLFAPTPQTSPGTVLTSLSPQVHDPVLAISVWQGRPERPTACRSRSTRWTRAR